MVKRGGTKRKATMKKITNRGSLATTFTKRTNGLFSKVSQFCLLTQAQMAVLITPASSNSNVSFYSFGHSSVDSVVNAYLTGQRPVREETTKDDHEDLGICMTRQDLGLDLWWEDDRLIQSAPNPEELADKISRMLMKINDLRSQDRHQAFVNDDDVSMKQTESSLDQTLILPSDSNFNGLSEEQDKTLNLQSCSQICCNPILLDDDIPADYNNVMTEEQEQIRAICDSFCVPENSNNNNVMTEEQDQILTVCDSFFVPENSNNKNVMTEEQDQIMAVGDSFSVPEIDLDQLIDFDFDMTLDASAFDAAFSHEQACDDEASKVGDLDEDLMFSNYLTQFLQA